MREYVTPRMTGETFASNEYISVCWGVECNVDGQIGTSGGMTIQRKIIEKHIVEQLDING